MVMKTLRDGASGGLGKFILFGFMVLAAGGLVMMDVGGFFRGSAGSSDAAIIGKDKISIQNFDRIVRTTLGRIGMSPQEAYSAGYIDQIMAAEIRASLLRQAGLRHGILISKKKIAEQIHEIMAPYVQNGQDPKDVLRQILANQGMSEQVFVHSIRQDMGNNLLNSALNGGFAEAAPAIIHDIYRHAKERRTIEYVVFMNDEIGNIPEPTDEQLHDLYLSLQESFAQPETRRFKLIAIKDEAIKQTLDISEEEIRQTYDNNIDLYTVRESRTIEQALLNTQEDAQAVIDQLNSGKNLEEAVKAVTSKTTAYLGKQDTSKNTVIQQVKDQVMAATQTGAVIGPLQTSSGWYVAVVNAIHPEKIKSFEEAGTEIRNEMMQNLMIDQQYALANHVDDLFASGATLEEVAEQIDLKIEAFPAVDRYGQTKDGKDGLKDHKDDKITILETVFQLDRGETSPVFENTAGDFTALYLEELNPKSYTPYEEVKQELHNRWIADQKRVSARVQAVKQLSEINAGNIALSDFAKRHGKELLSASAIGRDEDPQGVLNLRSVMNLFEAPPGETVLVDVDGGVAIAEVTDFSWPGKIDENTQSFKQIQGDFISGSQQEALTLYLRAQQNIYGAKINNRLINRMYGLESQDGR